MTVPSPFGVIEITDGFDDVNTVSLVTFVVVPLAGCSLAVYTTCSVMKPSDVWPASTNVLGVVDVVAPVGEGPHATSGVSVNTVARSSAQARVTEHTPPGLYADFTPSGSSAM